MNPSILELKFFLNDLFWKKTMSLVCFLGNWQRIFSWLEVNITLSINKTNKTGMDINDDIYRCTAHDLELCASVLRERHSHVSVFARLCVCVCVRAIPFPSDVPFDLWPHSRGQALTNEMVEFWPELQTFHNNLVSSSSPLLVSVIPHPSTPLCSSPPRLGATRGKFSLQTNTLIVFAVGTSKHTPCKLRITTSVKI